MIQAAVITLIKIGSQRGVMRPKMARAATLAIAMKGVRGWLNTMNAKITTTQANRIARCRG